MTDAMKKQESVSLPSLVRFAHDRQLGLKRRGYKSDAAQRYGEYRAATPVTNLNCEVSGQTKSTFVMAFSHDATMVASSHGDHSVRVTDLCTGKCLHTLIGHPRTPWTLAFHPSSSDILASGCLAGDVRIWDLKGGGSEVWKVPDRTVIASVSFHPTDQVLVIGTANLLYFWDWSHVEPFCSCKTNNDYEKVRWVKFDSLGHYLYTGIANGSTIQRDENIPNAASFSSERFWNGDSVGDVLRERHRLRQQYRSLLSRFSNHQSHRDSIPPTAPYSRASTSGSLDLASVLDPVLDPDLRDLPEISPVQREAVEEARLYAQRVTRETSHARTGARLNSLSHLSRSLLRNSERMQRSGVLAPTNLNRRRFGFSYDSEDDEDDTDEDLSRLSGLSSSSSRNSRNERTPLEQDFRNFRVRSSLPEENSLPGDIGDESGIFSSQIGGPESSFVPYTTRDGALDGEIRLATPRLSFSEFGSLLDSRRSSRNRPQRESVLTSSSLTSDLGVRNQLGRSYLASNLGDRLSSATTNSIDNTNDITTSSTGDNTVRIRHQPGQALDNAAPTRPLSGVLSIGELMSSRLERGLSQPLSTTQPYTAGLVPASTSAENISNSAAIPGARPRLRLRQFCAPSSLNSNTNNSNLAPSTADSTITTGFVASDSASDSSALDAEPSTGAAPPGGASTIGDLYAHYSTRMERLRTRLSEIRQVNERSRIGSLTRSFRERAARMRQSGALVRQGAFRIRHAQSRSERPRPDSSRDCSATRLRDCSCVDQFLARRRRHDVDTGDNAPLAQDGAARSRDQSRKRQRSHSPGNHHTSQAHPSASGPSAGRTNGQQPARKVRRVESENMFSSSPSRSTPDGAISSSAIASCSTADICLSSVVSSESDRRPPTAGCSTTESRPPTAGCSTSESRPPTAGCSTSESRPAIPSLENTCSTPASSSTTIAATSSAASSTDSSFARTCDRPSTAVNPIQPSPLTLSLSNSLSRRYTDDMSRCLREPGSSDPLLSMANAAPYRPTTSGDLVQDGASLPSSFSSLDDPTGVNPEPRPYNTLLHSLRRRILDLHDQLQRRIRTDDSAQNSQRPTLSESNAASSSGLIDLTSTSPFLDQTPSQALITMMNERDALDREAESVLMEPASRSALEHSAVLRERERWRDACERERRALDHWSARSLFDRELRDPRIRDRRPLRLLETRSLLGEPRSLLGISPRDTRNRRGDGDMHVALLDTSPSSLLASEPLRSPLRSELQQLMDEPLPSSRLRPDAMSPNSSRVLRQRASARPHVIPEITVTRPAESPLSLMDNTDSDDDVLSPDPPGDDRSAIVRNLNMIRFEAMRVRFLQRERERERQQQREHENQQFERRWSRSWHDLQRRHLHPHYSLDEGFSRTPHPLFPRTINIPGAFASTNDPSLSTIIPLTHRIQRWDFRFFTVPDISHSERNVIVSNCKLHNDSSVELSRDGQVIAAFVASQGGFPDDSVLAIYSLHKDTLGQCLFTKSFGPNAVCVSISPRSERVLVGLAAKRTAWVWPPNHLVAQVFSLHDKAAGEFSMKLVHDIVHPCATDLRTQHVSVNSVKWLPGEGRGIIYGTNRGHLIIKAPGIEGRTVSKGIEDEVESGVDQQNVYAPQPLRRNIMEMLGLAPRTTSTSTQTTDDGAPSWRLRSVTVNNVRGSQGNAGSSNQAETSGSQGETSGNHDNANSQAEPSGNQGDNSASDQAEGDIDNQGDVVYPLF